jgi:hypothetical protein
MPKAQALFSLGRLLATPGALRALEEAGEQPLTFFDRHESGDWGEVGAEDHRANDRAVEGEARILSAYRTSRGVKLWVITEADRSATTLLLPEDY